MHFKSLTVRGFKSFASATTLRLEPGITCVVGPNGAGKSTLLGSICGLLKPRLGQVTLRGERLSGKTPRQVLDMGVVLVPQNHSLFREMTVRENIMLGGYILRERGLVRAEYEASTLRGNLGLPVPENRYTRAREAADDPVTVVPVAG